METKEHPLVLHPEERELLVREAADSRRLYELAAAVRDHEATIRTHIGGPRPHDLALYRRLRRIGAPDSARPADALMDLVDAVLAHEVLTRHRAVPKRPADHSLYRRITR